MLSVSNYLLPILQLEIAIIYTSYLNLAIKCFVDYFIANFVQFEILTLKQANHPTFDVLGVC